METGFALTVQRLPTDSDRVLVLGELAGLRNTARRFSTGEVAALFAALRIPSPSNISARLGDLRTRGLVVKLGNSWALTPEGRVASAVVVGKLDPQMIEVELRGVSGAELGHAKHSVISPALAPQKWVEPIARLLEEFPFEGNVFLMTRLPESPGDDEFLDPVRDVIPTAGEALGSHGLRLHLASERQLDDDLLGNVAAHMWACQYGVGLLEARSPRGLNYNAVIEVGAMLMTGRRCALLRDSVTAPNLPSDLVGQIYKSVDFDNHAAVAGSMHLWASLDLGLGRCPSCPPEG